jgi:hypothetical protein
VSVQTILDAIQDRSLFGASPVFTDLEPWKPWLVFLSAVYGLPLDPEGVELFKQCTGRSVYDLRPAAGLAATWTEARHYSQHEANPVGL